MRNTATEVRRVVQEQVKTVEGILDRADEDLNKCVHESRKELKKLRAVIRLVRCSIGSKVYKRENAAVRDAGRALGPFRDAWVRYSLVRKMRRKETDTFIQDALEPVEDQLLEQYRQTLLDNAVPRAIQTTRSLLTDIGGRVAKWPLDEKVGFDLYREGLLKVYQRGHSDCLLCRKKPSVKNLHDWRKRGKYLRYHLDLLQPAFPKLLDAMEDSLHDLTNGLGDSHDLAILREALEQLAARDFLAGEQYRAISDELKRRHDQLVEPCWLLGKLHYTEKPDRFVARIEAYWKASAGL